MLPPAMPRSTTGWVLASASCFVLVGLGVGFAPRLRSEPAASFTVEYTELSFGASSGRVVQQTRFYTRRADGADVMGLHGALFDSRIVKLPGSRQIVRVSDVERNQIHVRLREVWSQFRTRGAPTRLRADRREGVPWLPVSPRLSGVRVPDIRGDRGHSRRSRSLVRPCA